MAKKRSVVMLGILTVALTAILCLGVFFLAVLLMPQKDDLPVMLRATASPDIVSIPTPAKEKESPAPAPSTPVPTPSSTPTPVSDASARIRLVGDIMCHDRQLRAAEQEDGSYVMDDWFASIAPSLHEADLVIGNLETTFAGEEEEYTGFPHFNTPDALADALKNAGFDVLTTANNHTYDFRARGILRTLDVLDDRGLKHTGAYASEEAYDEPLLVQVNGIQVGILAYTDTFNSKPKEDFTVRALSREQVQADVQRLRQLGADFILCMVHWGEEYEESPNRTQRERAVMLAESGVDAIFGSHPHVVQTAEMLTVEDETGVSRTVPVAYSMGNFISNQQNRPCDMGIIFEIELKKEGQTGRTGLVRTAYVPTVVYRGHADHRDTYDVLPCGVYMEKEDHPKRHRCQTVWKYETGLMGDGFAALEK